VLARTGLAAGAISTGLYSLVLNTAVVTMVLTPVVSSLTSPVYRWLSRRRESDPVQTLNLGGSPLAGHVIIAGAGRVGCGIADVLRHLDLPVVLIELDHRRIDRVRADGRPVIFGDAAQPAVLEAAGVERARLLLVTIPVLGVSRAVIEYARRLNPEISIVARAELLHLRMPTLDILHLTDRLREAPYAPAFERHAEHYPELSRLAGATRLLDLRWVRMAEGSPMHGRTIGELAVRSVTGASVAGLLRQQAFTAGPGPDARLVAGDLVAIVGDPAQIGRFEEAAAPPDDSGQA
jgi:CPA2 family monovalent cation:H+ antiporter-2